MNSNVTLKLQKGTNPLFDAQVTIENWKEKEALYVAKSSGYTEAVRTGKVRKITVQHKDGTMSERFAMPFAGNEITSGNCRAVDENGEIVGNYLFTLAEQGIILKGSPIVDAPFGPAEQTEPAQELPY